MKNEMIANYVFLCYCMGYTITALSAYNYIVKPLPLHRNGLTITS